jgi:ATP-binding cassette, subfamily C (CFTR/MRP), member 1
LADNIIVLDNDGKAIEQGTFSNLRSSDGFVGRLSLHPEILESDPISKTAEDTAAFKAPPAALKVLQGPSANDIADLTRQTGDISVYKYYLKSIGWTFGLANAMGSIIYMFGSKSPRKCSRL